MPRLISVNPSGYFSYGLHHTIPLDNQGLILLNGFNKDKGGTANGSGKTSLFYAISQILFGKNASGETGEAVIHEFLGKSFGRIVFLDDQNRKWRITETKKWRKTDKYPDAKLNPDTYIEEPSEIHTQGARYSGTDVYLERWNGSIWLDERNTNVASGAFRLDLKATRKKILDVLRMDYDQFMNIGYMAQQQTLKFINGGHKDRLQVLGSLVKFDAWDERIKMIRADIAELESEQTRTESELIGLRKAGISLNTPNPEQLILWETMLKDYDRQVAECDVEIKGIDMAVAKWRQQKGALDEQIQIAYTDVRRQTLLRQGIQESLDGLVQGYIQKCNTIRERPRQPEIAQLEVTISETRGQIQARRFDLEQLLAGSGKCPRCRTNVTIDHILRQRELLQVEIRDLEERVKIAEEQLGVLVEAWQTSIKHDLDLASDEYQFGKQMVEIQLSTIDAALNTLSQETESYREQRQALGDDPTRRIDAVAQKRLFLLSEKSRIDEKTRLWHEQKKNHDEYQKTISTAEARLVQYRENILYRQALDKLFGDKGFKAWKLNNLLAELNHTLREYVDIITNQSTSLWVTQYREKSDGEMTADIQIMVREGHKKDVPFALYSGGEKQQIMLAFIGAFWQLASRHGAGINTLLMDEILGPLDDINAQKVFGFIEHMRHQGKSTIIITTHSQNVKDQVKFNKIWTAVMENQTSTLTYN